MVDGPKYEFHILASIGFSLSHSLHRHPNIRIHISQSITLLCGLETHSVHSRVYLQSNYHAMRTRRILQHALNPRCVREDIGSGRKT